MIDFCGHEPPIALYTYDNWTHHETSGDQKCIEAVLPQYVTPESVWLHIGIGNSSLAKLYASQIKRLDGITVCQEERDTAPDIPNYYVWICDKHNPLFLSYERYDVIVDTTPFGHACCKRHLEQYFRNVFSMLRGYYLTDKVGLAWAQPTSKGQAPEEFEQYIKRFGNLKMRFVTETVIEVRK